MRFWESKTLAEMTTTEWESLCDRCGNCCLVKLEDEETGEIAVTRVVCKLMDIDSCLCTDYQNRCSLVADCIDLRQHEFAEYRWLPATCAYRLLAEGKPLPNWHPLLTGTPDSVKHAGISIHGFAIKESTWVDPEDHIIEWLS
ncbi:MAG: hypothetical protein CTY19_00360 [Methylomonas sp.]|nr:MAG: hypothetical protein CTY19_00360 [Methylomonas sp.]